ncbi:MAG: glycosyltransferase family 2 protein [Thermomicrobiales bacterium]
MSDSAGALASDACARGLLPGVSAVVPVYNSASTIERLTSRIAAALTALGEPFEIILVNDGSADGSWREIETAAARHPGVRGVDLMRNYGQHSALLCGIRAARHEVIVTLDDDLQNPPEEIGALLAALGPGVDVVYGAPENARHGLARNAASRITKLALQGAMGVETVRSISSFRAFRTPVRDAFAEYRSPTVNIDVLLTWGTTRFASVLVRHEERAEGRSTYTVRKLIAHALSMITGFSVLPLQFATMLGFVFTLMGMLVFLYVIGSYLFRGTSVAGFPFLACIIAIFSGVQLFAIGMIGEYLARVHVRTMDRPSYVVRDWGEDGRDR